ncbi:MAG: hypothetical protein ACREC0_11770 [Methylocella sp.]
MSLRTFGLLPGAMRGLPFDRKVEALILDHSGALLIVLPMLVAWRQLRAQIVAFDKGVRPFLPARASARVSPAIAPASRTSSRSR